MYKQLSVELYGAGQMIHLIQTDIQTPDLDQSTRGWTHGQLVVAECVDWDLQGPNSM